MQPDWWMGLIGGLMIGGGSAILLLFNGRIAGVSGIAGRVLALGRGWPGGDWPSPVFLMGLVAGPALLAAAGHPPAIEITDTLVPLLLGGLLVGYGTRLGSGCTSGHGVCGLSRGSRRSLVAVSVFMAVAATTVTAIRHLPGAWS